MCPECARDITSLVTNVSLIICIHFGRNASELHSNHGCCFSLLPKNFRISTVVLNSDTASKCS